MWDEVRRKGKEGSLSDVTGRMENKGGETDCRDIFLAEPCFSTEISTN
jgi:hypothetical protein